MYGEKLDGNYTRMLQAILNKSWQQHPTKQQLYCHLSPIMKTIQVRRTRHAGHCWRSRDELISNILLWTPSHGRAKAGRPARTSMPQLCADTGCSLPGAMDDREGQGDPCWRRNIMMMMIMFTNPSARAGYDTRSVFKRSLTGLNSEFSFT